jgi:hypothetical protein
VTIQEAYDAILRELGVPTWKYEPGTSGEMTGFRVKQILMNLQDSPPHNPHMQSRAQDCNQRDKYGL